jgi:hypothetical protein
LLLVGWSRVVVIENDNLRVLGVSGACEDG